MRKLLLKTKCLFRLSCLILLPLGVLLGPAPVEAFSGVADTQGKTHRLADYKGRWVVVNFWATWCVPCIQEIPEIAEFHKHNARVVVLGVAMDAENPGKVKAFAAKVGHTYPLVLADARVEKQLGDPKALPTTRVYDPAGKVVYDRVGRVTRKSLEELTGVKPAAAPPASTTLAPSDQRSRSARVTSSG
jgi:thiol-disulfide isomerase/thioredoxin